MKYLLTIAAVIIALGCDNNPAKATGEAPVTPAPLDTVLIYHGLFDSIETHSNFDTLRIPMQDLRYSPIGYVKYSGGVVTCDSLMQNCHEVFDSIYWASSAKDTATNQMILYFHQKLPVGKRMNDPYVPTITYFRIPYTMLFRLIK
ncbi:MAG: hypothetical protein WC657_08435 [Candidatus Paceibacterota bacterium]|jgi:hypothetical protein